MTTYGKPGTIGIITHRQYTVWCTGCNNEWADFCPSKAYFRVTIRESGWKMINKKWTCPGCVADKEKVNG